MQITRYGTPAYTCRDLVTFFFAHDDFLVLPATRTRINRHTAPAIHVCLRTTSTARYIKHEEAVVCVVSLPDAVGKGLGGLSLTFRFEKLSS